MLIGHRFGGPLATQFHCNVDTSLLVTDHALAVAQVHALDRPVDEPHIRVGGHLDAVWPREKQTDNGRGNERADNNRKEEPKMPGRMSGRR